MHNKREQTTRNKNNTKVITRHLLQCCKHLKFKTKSMRWTGAQIETESKRCGALKCLNGSKCHRPPVPAAAPAAAAVAGRSCIAAGLNTLAYGECYYRCYHQRRRRLCCWCCCHELPNEIRCVWRSFSFVCICVCVCVWRSVALSELWATLKPNKCGWQW